MSFSEDEEWFYSEKLSSLLDRTNVVEKRKRKTTEEAIAWMKSPEGAAAFKEAKKQADETIKLLQEGRKPFWLMKEKSNTEWVSSLERRIEQIEQQLHAIMSRLDMDEGIEI